MLKTPTRLRCDEDGFSLVELLVVILIAGVVGAVAVSGLVGGMRTTAITQERIDASNELQIALERMSREVRAADPIVAATGNSLEVRVHRDGQCFRFTYRLTADEQLQVRRDVSADDCASFTNGTFALLVADVVNTGPVFTYQTEDGAVTTTKADIATVTMEVVRDLREQQPVTATAIVHVRNA